MATYTGTAALYTLFKLNLGKALIDFTNGAHYLKVALVTSSYTPGTDTHDFADDITNEVTGSGYARQTVTGTWNNTGSTVKLALTDPTFTATGGSITARRWVLLLDNGGAASANPLLAYGLLNSAGTDVVTTDGNDLVIDFNDANGLFQF